MNKRTIYKRLWRAKNVIRSRWHDLRSRAKQRKIPCPISYNDFEAFCLRTKYHLYKGKERFSYSIDRIKDTWPDGTVRGYDKDNIQVLELWKNSSKEQDRRKACKPWYSIEGNNLFTTEDPF